MPKYYCDYCDVFLTHDSTSVRKAHNSGRNHIQNVRDYYAAMGHDKAQDIIDQITNSYANAPPGGMMGGPPSGPPPMRMGPGFMGAPGPGGLPPPMMGGGMGGGPPMMNGGELDLSLLRPSLLLFAFPSLCTWPHLLIPHLLISTSFPFLPSTSLPY
ncbi:U1 zinc finger-domain-containing protein [Mrakia frigida]|uniref:Yhc1p n=1 Tax=Mrakia frigida TaxID=29902 RepID=UPI003FCC1C01